MNETDFLREAVKIAMAGVRKGQTPFGAVVVKGGKVIARAHNAVWKTTDSTAHAEVRALRAACKKLKTIDLSGCTLYSTCEPCPMCFAACHWARIDTVVYGARIADAKACGFNELTIPNTYMKRKGKSTVRLRGGILRDECLAVFKAWAKRPGRKAY